jgi:hypothetical protein
MPFLLRRFPVPPVVLPATFVRLVWEASASRFLMLHYYYTAVIEPGEAAGAAAVRFY